MTILTLKSKPTALVTRWALIVWSGTALFAGLHSALIVSRFHRFGVYTFDFGIFDQGLWLLSRFEDPFVTLRGLNLFADHSSYIMVLLTPLYWLWADPRILLVFTVVALASAAPLLFAIGTRLGVRPGLAAVISLAFLAHPALRWATWDNFHPEFLVMPLVLGATLFILHDRPWWAAGLAALALTAKEDAALLIVPFGLWVAWQQRQRAAGLVIAALGAAAFLVNFLVFLPFFSPTDGVLYTGRYAGYGSSALGIIAGVATQPASVLSDVTRPDALSYLRDMVLVAPAGLAAPAVLVLGVPITLANMLSTHFYQIDIRYHYTIYLATVVGMAAMFGAARIQRRFGPRGARALGIVIVIAAVVGLGPGPGRAAWGGVEDGGEIEAALALIGPDDGVSAESTIAVHLAHRRVVYRFPNPFRELDYGAPQLAYDPPVEDLEWIAVDPQRITNFAYAAEALEAVRRSGEWTTVVDGERILLLRRR